MSNFKECIFNDGKEKQQSFEYTIETKEHAPWYYNNFSITGYGADIEEAKSDCIKMLKEFLTDLNKFVDKIGGAING